MISNVRLNKTYWYYFPVNFDDIPSAQRNSKPERGTNICWLQHLRCSLFICPRFSKKVSLVWVSFRHALPISSLNSLTILLSCSNIAKPLQERKCVKSFFPTTLRNSVIRFSFTASILWNHVKLMQEIVVGGKSLYITLILVKTKTNNKLWSPNTAYAICTKLNRQTSRYSWPESSETAHIHSVSGEFNLDLPAFLQFWNKYMPL